MMGIVEISQLDQDDLALLDAALATDHSGVDKLDVYELYSLRKVQIWKFLKGEARAIAVTEITPLKTGKQLTVRWLAGNGVVDNLEYLTKRIESFAKSQGCRWVFHYTRPGMARILERELNYQDRSVTVLKEL